MSTEVLWLCVCGVFAVGEALGFAMPEISALWPLAAGLAVFAAVPGILARWRYIALVIAFFVGFACSLHSIRVESESEKHILSMTSVSPYTSLFEVEGPSTMRKSRNGEIWYSFPSSIGSMKVRVLFESNAAPKGVQRPQPGDVWECSGSLTRMVKRGGRRNFWVRGPKSSARLVIPASENGGSLAATIATLKKSVAQRLSIGIEHDPLAISLLKGILLGEKTETLKSEIVAFSTAGTLHVFAVSGLHVAIIAAVLRFILAFLMIPSRFVGILSIPILWFYAAVIGYTPSAVRATAMISIACIGLFFWRKPNSTVAWSATFLAVYAEDPGHIADIGCILSFAVMLSLVLWREYMSGDVISKKYDFPMFSLVAWAAGMPIIVYAFGRISLGAILANLAVVPLISIALATSVTGIVVSFVSPFIAGHINNISALTMKLTSGISTVVASIPGASIELAKWGVLECFLWYLAMFLTAYLVRSIVLRRKRLFWS